MKHSSIPFKTNENFWVKKLYVNERFWKLDQVFEIGVPFLWISLASTFPFLDRK
jgi:hypothetical protein